MAVFMMEKQGFKALSHQGTKIKHKGETEQHIVPPLMREKPIFFSLRALPFCQITRAKNLKLESRKPVKLLE